jgi:hypothetical protein
VNDQSAIINAKVQVILLSPHHKQPTEASIMTPTQPQAPVYLEIDPNFVNISFALLEDGRTLHDKTDSIIVKTADAKKLGLIHGEVLTLKLVKDSQK